MSNKDRREGTDALDSRAPTMLTTWWKTTNAPIALFASYLHEEPFLFLVSKAGRIKSARLLLVREKLRRPAAPATAPSRPPW